MVRNLRLGHLCDLHNYLYHNYLQYSVSSCGMQEQSKGMGERGGLLVNRTAISYVRAEDG